MKFSPPTLFEVGFLKAQFTKKGWGGEENVKSLIPLPSIFPDPDPLQKLT